MAKTTTSLPSFSRIVAAPVFLIFAVTLALVAGFVHLSLKQSDAGALEHQSALLQLALDNRIHQSTRGQLDLSVWDESLLAHAGGDTDWFGEHFGADGYSYYAQHQVYILNPDLTPFFAMQNGGAIPASSFETMRSQLMPFIERIFAVDNQAGIAAYKADNRNNPPVITDIALVDGRPAIISVSPLVSDSLDLNADPGMDPIYISVTMLDATVAKELTDQYLLHGARFDTDATAKASEVALALNNAAGEPTVWFKWLPDRPGERLLNDTLPALGLGFIVLVAIVALLLRNLHKVGRQLYAERTDAQHRALHDPLTGLGNRALFREQLEQTFHNMPRSVPSIAMLALDLDRFKQVNDAFGHEAGDELLRQVSARITAILRPTDTLVRLGGDEFAIIQTAIADKSDPAALANRVISAIRSPFHLGDNIAEVGVSIGIETAPDNALTPDELVSRADDALYRAKAGGRNRYCFYTQNAPVDKTNAALERRVHQAMHHRGAA